jgi:hypothetical protein
VVVVGRVVVVVGRVVVVVVVALVLDVGPAVVDDGVSLNVVELVARWMVVEELVVLNEVEVEVALASAPEPDPDGPSKTLPQRPATARTMSPASTVATTRGPALLASLSHHSRSHLNTTIRVHPAAPL